MVNAQRLASAFAAARRKTGFSGYACVESFPGGETLFAGRGGFADRVERRRAGPETLFASASGSKIFTACAVLSLVQEGRLGLDTRLKDALPGVDFPLFDPVVTVRHLLTHTSGVPDYFDEDAHPEADAYALLWQERPMYRMQSGRDFLPLFAHLPMKFAPGERFAYNNAGFILLELIVEAVSGQPFAQAVGERVLAPAGITSSGYFRSDCLPRNCAVHIIDRPDGSWRTHIFSVPVVGGGDGGARVCAADWSRFWRALWAEKILARPLLDEMLTAQVATRSEPGYAYGLGVWRNTVMGTPCWYVVGEDPGVQMVSALFPEAGVLMHMLSNIDAPAWDVYFALRKAALTGSDTQGG